ncbi:phosphoribosylamidoimidazole-succinocarboxamidesynthase [Aspergillus sclerotioniger CBS 115572]|uniref:Phosphoribosylaminoimidazole-succinocarboxamide synthase n=1 Tax=Aspergillus sclerotioniger CBS 115572 TaxID=1450535 RepID=A0A317W088_9EURO|nr:phosphoribosylamidoimidazole-succinocarboxamidesynthase [Aspergillus sclerotioniger CBS 115572]PWY79415.1 phosphoribosylamidoimidazole-succinocarboxamidesynthase [Aspergillus sclerotioniger CBS 115572]
MATTLEAGHFQTHESPAPDTILVRDALYGDHTITEPVLIDLLQSPDLRRLIGIGQHGVTGHLGLLPKPVKITRFEHSVGALLLVRIAGASVEEQVTALLHDISHTVLSHVPGKESFHETTQIPAILTKHGIPQTVLDEEQYPLVEMGAPHLCADRLDYSLRDAVAFGMFALDDSHRVVAALKAFPDASSPHRMLVLNDQQVALRLARAYLTTDREVWSNPTHVEMYRKTGQLIGDLVRGGQIQEAVLWSMSDEDFWELLKDVADPDGAETLEKFETEGLGEAHGLRLHKHAKVRTIDPDIAVAETEAVALSVVDPDWAVERQEYIRGREATRESLPSTMTEAFTQTDLQGALPLIARGKVRDLYEIDDKTLLFVATDRISAYDVIMENGILNKGILLTLCTQKWFSILTSALPSLRTHFLTLDLPPQIPESLRPVLQNRSMQVRKLRILPIEAIVRGYITGSAWKEYQTSGTVHGIPVKEGLRESEAFPDGPIYTPSTKAEQGEHDENIHPDKAVEILGGKYAATVAALAIQLYKVAHEYALTRGVIIADTKFEFGVDEETGEVVLADEVLTPDSSRFWPKDTYEIGRGQASFDKQFLRDWLVKEGLKGKEGVRMTEEIAQKTAEKYKEAWEKITGGN